MISSDRVAIIDYHMGNLLSVARACEHVGLRPAVTTDKNELLRSQAAILPGVGAYGDAMDQLRRLDLVSPLHDFIASGRPLMGICLGMQLLLTESDEFGSHRGLDVIHGSVVRFTAGSGSGRRIKVPQVGWNKIFLPPAADQALWSRSLLNGIPTGEFMYFVHSYYVIPVDPSVTLSTTTYEDTTYCSGVRHNNVTAFQFHPEKSGTMGLAIYRNFKQSIASGGTA